MRSSLQIIQRTARRPVHKGGYLYLMRAAHGEFPIRHIPPLSKVPAAQENGHPPEGPEHDPSTAVSRAAADISGANHADARLRLSFGLHRHRRPGGRI